LLFSQYDGFLHRELRKKKHGIKLLELNEDKVKISGYKHRHQELTLFFTSHKTTVTNGRISESFEAVFSLSNPNDTGNTEILRKRIDCDHDYFINLIHFDNWQRDQHQKEILEMARNVLL